MTIDDLRPEPSKISMLCHADSLGILPIQWCLKNGVNLTPPKGLYSFSMICSFPLKEASLLLSAFKTTPLFAAQHHIKHLQPEHLCWVTGAVLACNSLWTSLQTCHADRLMSMCFEFWSKLHWSLGNSCKMHLAAALCVQSTRGALKTVLC